MHELHNAEINARKTKDHGERNRNILSGTKRLVPSLVVITSRVPHVSPEAHREHRFVAGHGTDTTPGVVLVTAKGDGSALGATRSAHPERDVAGRRASLSLSHRLAMAWGRPPGVGAALGRDAPITAVVEAESVAEAEVGLRAAVADGLFRIVGC